MDVGAIRLVASAVAFALLASGAACGDPTVEDRLIQAQETLQGARDAVRSAQADLAASEQAVEAAAAVREAAREALRKAEASLLEVESQIDLEETDALLFRAVQSRLLEDSRLQDVAIRAEVERGVVTLHGRVANEETRNAALEVVRSLSGVASVDNRISLTQTP